MNFKNLEYFVAVAEEKSIRKAAGKLYISEQSLGENIHRLEEELDVKLIGAGRPLELTEAGKVFEKHAKDILKKRDEMVRETISVNNYHNNDSRVVISFGPSMIPPFAPALLAAFQREFPQYRVNMILKDERSFQQFSVGELFFMPEREGENLECIPVFKDRLVVLVKEDLLQKCYPESWEDVLNSFKESGDIRLLERLTFADWKKDENIGFGKIRELLQKIDFHPEILELSFNQESNYEFVKQGLCAMVGFEDLSRQIAGEDGLEDNRILMLPLQLEGMTESIVGLQYLKHKKLNMAEKAFCEFAKEYFDFKS